MVLLRSYMNRDFATIKKLFTLNGAGSSFPGNIRRKSADKEIRMSWGTTVFLKKPEGGG
jgi:hypothetical protein